MESVKEMTEINLVLEACEPLLLEKQGKHEEGFKITLGGVITKDEFKALIAKFGFRKIAINFVEE